MYGSFLFVKSRISLSGPENDQKMTKYTQTIRWLLPTNFLSMFDHFVGLAFIIMITNFGRLNKRRVSARLY